MSPTHLHRSPPEATAAYQPPEPLRRLRPEIPADLDAIVLRCLAKKPGDRYADVGELERALRGCWTSGSGP